MGVALTALAQLCSPKKPTVRELQEAAAARVRELEVQLAESRESFASSSRAQSVRVEQIEFELRQSQAALAESRQALEARRREWERERAALTADFEARLQRAARELEDSYAALSGLRLCIEAANAPIVAVDTVGLVQERNRVAAEVFGLGDQPQPLAECLPREGRAEFLRLQRQVLGGRPLARCRLRLRAAGKPWHEVLLLASRRVDARGVPRGALYIGQDLTEQAAGLREAELAAQDLRRLLRCFSAPIIGVDAAGRVDEWNARAELLTGYTSSEAIGRAFLPFIAEDLRDSVQLMLSQGLQGQEVTNYEFSLLTKAGQRREILWSATARRSREGDVVGVIGVGQDITELRSESKMLANYVRICGAAVWSLRGDAMTGVVTDSKTKEIEHLISQQAQMDICDPRMVLWRASFVSILKTMCQNFWMRRKGARGPPEKTAAGVAVFTTDFAYEFCFEAPNGSVKWYKVQGHLIQECLTDSQFEVTGSMQEVTSMLIDKVMGDRWQKWWNRMCHMVFDATLLVDTQEYRVLNAWGEEKVFGCKLQSNHPLLPLIKHDDTVSLKEAFNEVTFKGFERGRTLHLLRPGCDKDMPAQCFLLSADQENPNECMMGIRMQVSGSAGDDVSVLWDVAKPNPVLTLEDLARLKSGLRRSHRRPSRNVRSVHRPPHRSRSSDPHTSSHSLSSIPEDLHGEFEEDDLQSISDRGSEAADSVAEDTESLRSSSKSSNSSNCSNGSVSDGGVCNSSPARSANEEVCNTTRDGAGATHLGDLAANPFALSPKLRPKSPTVSPPPLRKREPAPVRLGPAVVILRWRKKSFDVNLDDFVTIATLRARVGEMTGVPPGRQTLILAGRRLPPDDESFAPGDPTWSQLKASVRHGQALMMIGSVPSEAEAAAAGQRDRQAAAPAVAGAAAEG